MSLAPEFIRNLKRSQQQSDKILRPFYQEQFRDGHFVCVHGDSPIVRIMQATLHIDIMGNRKSTGDLLTIDEKMRNNNFDDLLIELEACTIPGREKPGWYVTQNIQKVSVEVTLFAFVHRDERGATCIPLVMKYFRPWFDARVNMFEDHIADNPMHGEKWFTHNKKVPCLLVRRELGVEGFNLRDGKIVEDFFGRPRMDWIL